VTPRFISSWYIFWHVFFMWGIGTGLSLEHGDTLHLPAGRGHLTHTPMSGEDVQWKSL
ncbi:hypothetical protein GBAR_LOCUS24626, partial [Geodia barretti]